MLYNSSLSFHWDYYVKEIDKRALNSLRTLSMYWGHDKWSAIEFQGAPVLLREYRYVKYEILQVHTTSASYNVLRLLYNLLKEQFPEKRIQFFCLGDIDSVPEGLKSCTSYTEQEALSDIELVIDPPKKSHEPMYRLIRKIPEYNFTVSEGSYTEAIDFYEKWKKIKKQRLQSDKIPGYKYKSILNRSQRNCIKEAYQQDDVRKVLLRLDGEPVALSIMHQDDLFTHYSHAPLEIGLSVQGISASAVAMYYNLQKMSELGCEFSFDGSLYQGDPGATYHKLHYTRPEKLKSKRILNMKFS